MEQLEQYKKQMKSNLIHAINSMMKIFGVEEISALLELEIKIAKLWASLHSKSDAF